MRFDAQALVKGGVRDLSVDIDAAPALTDPLTATLIRILRDVRARGGSLTVVAGREPLLRGLHRHALDRIVSVVRPQPLTSAI